MADAAGIVVALFGLVIVLAMELVQQHHRQQQAACFAIVFQIPGTYQQFLYDFCGQHRYFCRAVTTFRHLPKQAGIAEQSILLKFK